MSSLRRKSVLVIGGSSGIGLATAKAALEQQAVVTIASRDEQSLQAAAEQLGSSAKSATVDLLQNESIIALSDRLGSFDPVVVTAAKTKTGGGGTIEA